MVQPMKHKSFLFNALALLFVAIIILSSCKKYEFDFYGTTSERTVYSSIVDDEFKVYYYLPPNLNPSEAYPVIFLLDGDWYFDDFSRELNDLIQGGLLEPVILVGIGYPDNIDEKRFRDYTFPTDPEYELVNGEADKFRRFLREELIPEIAMDYPTDTSKYVLAGHSLGGLNTLYNMLQANSPFSSYIAVSSSVWWSDAYLFGLEEAYFKLSTNLPAKTYLAVGGDEPPSMTILNTELTDRLKSRNYNGFRLKSEIFDGASHSQVPMIGFRKGIQFVLN
jgi:predicted alpha/beta superfamily hydrolase